MSQQLLQHNEQDHETTDTADKIVQEQKEETELSATINAVTDNGITVDLTTTRFQAEARIIQENGEERKQLTFNEDEEQHTHTVPCTDTIYEQFKQSPCTLLQNAMIDATTAVTAETQTVSPWSFITQLNRPQIDVTPEPDDLTFPQSDTVPEPDATPASINDIRPYTPFTVRHKQPAYTPQPSATPAYRPTSITHSEPGAAELVDTAINTLPDEQLLPDDTSIAVDDYLEIADNTVALPDMNTSAAAMVAQYTQDEPRYLPDTRDEVTDDADHLSSPLFTAEYNPAETATGLKAQISYTVSPETSGNATETIEHLFEQTDINGTIEETTYQDTADNYTTKESYWADIDGMDMMQTEFFINGELADDSLDSYDLAPGDTITFVEANMFGGTEGTDSADGGSCGGDLYLDDVLEEYDVTDTVTTPEDTYMTPPETGEYAAESREAAYTQPV